MPKKFWSWFNKNLGVSGADAGKLTIHMLTQCCRVINLTLKKISVLFKIKFSSEFSWVKTWFWVTLLRKKRYGFQRHSVGSLSRWDPLLPAIILFFSRITMQVRFSGTYTQNRKLTVLGEILKVLYCLALRLTLSFFGS